ncbi:UNVERIFIED_CONTAM: Pentatricopeptide repeat-containing protein [Sesamum latifolium]|uniref:Pentatricopeptide repeat-containing protein n=1 Tax=Sesamum latifolium TaxID=2727402 RepID=A0AAW2UZZ9_9LAMI
MKSKRIRRYPCVVQNFINLTSRGQLREAVDTLPLLSRKGFSLNSKLIALLLQKCAKAKSIKEGKWVHLHLKLTGGKHPNTFLANHLINMYAKCGDHVKAREMFDKMRDRNLYSWNNMLSGYASLGMAKAAKRLFDRMPEKDFVSWNTMVMACVQSGWFDQALRFYMELRSFPYWVLSNVVLSSSILDAYAKCGEMGDASRLFDEMRKKDVLAWTTLVSGYARWGDTKAARRTFDSMPEKNSVSWSALIAGYAHNGMGRHALKLFAEMVMLDVEPDQLTLSSCLLACACLISLEQGRQLHSYMITAGIRPNVVVVSSLIDMYSKCGSLEVSKRVFDTNENKQHAVLWNTMISALGHQGCGKQAIKFFVDMVRLGVKPDGVTFHALLSACSHSGLVQEGLCLFESMMPYYNIIPDQEHYSYLIDLLGQSGLFDELSNHLKKMPCKPDDHVWNALLGVCRIYGNVELARLMARHLVELEPQSTAAYLLLSGMYAALGRWESAEEVRRLMNVRHPEKDQALSWLEIDRKLHLDTEINKSRHPEKETTLILELLPDGSSLYNVESSTELAKVT